MPLKTALVTGASAGLGREIVRQLVRDRGMTVLATARRRDRLEALAAELPPGRVLVSDGDLANADFRARLWTHAEETFPGGLDLLVNNAGLGHYDEFGEQDPELVRRIIEINVIALFDLTQRALRQMKARDAGQILQISSVLGFVGLPYSAVYVASKHAVNGLVKSLRYELKGTGVRIWAACPGQTESEFWSVAVGGPGISDRQPRGEPTDRVVRAIVRGLDRRATFILPSAMAKAVVRAADWLPGPFDWLMGRWAPGYFKREIDEARAARESAAPTSVP